MMCGVYYLHGCDIFMPDVYFTGGPMYFPKRHKLKGFQKNKRK
jgi:hypothetical protein